MCAGCEQSHTNDTLVKYVYKYMSKPQQQHRHRVLCSGPLHNCPVMWHAQACMLLRASPLDVVRVICAHVDECDADFPMPATDRTIIGPDKRVLYKRKAHEVWVVPYNPCLLLNYSDRWASNTS